MGEPRSSVPTLLLLLGFAGVGLAAESPVAVSPGDTSKVALVEIRSEADLEAINYVQHQADEGFFEDGMAGYMAVIADDAVLMPPNAPPLEGKEAILAWGTDFLEAFTLEHYSSTDDEVVLAGDWAFRRATVTLRLKPKDGGEAVEDIGKYLIIYQRQPDGSWKIARDMFSSNMPPAARGIL